MDGRSIEAGADYVVSRSISKSLLRTHLLALMRLAPERPGPADNSVVVGDVVADVDGYTVFIGGLPVRFPLLQFKLLLALARRPNKVVSFGQLLDEVWGIEPRSVHPRRVRVAISLLRRLLGEGTRRPRLETDGWLESGPSHWQRARSRHGGPPPGFPFWRRRFLQCATRRPTARSR